LIVYLDTSFLSSLYRPDAHSASAFKSLGQARDQLVATVFGELEFVNAMQLAIFRGEMSAAEARACRNDFTRDLEDGIFRILPLPNDLFERAQEVSLKNTAALGTRSIDLLHVAAALELGAAYLYSFDETQRKLAGTLRLKLNPLP
jgi:predicted nucleic acid-binding protein